MTLSKSLLGMLVVAAVFYFVWTGRSSKPNAPSPPAQRAIPRPASATTPSESEPPKSEPRESSADFEVRLPEEPARPSREAAPTAERREEDRPHCLTLEATPGFTPAYGSAGLAVQLTVRARNRCATAFSGPGTFFRASAISMEGTELASATGRFAGEIAPFSTAETLIAIPTDPTRVRNWRVELR